MCVKERGEEGERMMRMNEESRKYWGSALKLQRFFTFLPVLS